MTILFVARHFTYFRNFESVIVALAGGGHHVHLAADREEAQGGRELVDGLAARFPSLVTVGFTPILQWGRYRRVSSALRLSDLRYSDPRYEATPKIRERAYERTPYMALVLARLPWRRAVAGVLDRVEQAVPRQLGVDDFIDEVHPDVLLITPLIELGSPQLDYVRAARAKGILSALCVWSWDHLSSKALIRVVPDRVVVWNETQRDEAHRFHGVPADRVVVTGAQCFDKWFDRTPSRDRQAFGSRSGVDVGGPFLLYVCSALFKNSPPEAAFVQRWVAAVRSAPDPRVREMPILVRPHPQRLAEWEGITASRLDPTGRTVLWGSNPIDRDGQADYFDSMYHAAAIVGLNTSAMVESAIVDRPVFTVLLPDIRDNQEGTFHFHHLLRVGEGFLNASRDLEAHVRQLSGIFTGTGLQANRPFVEAFIRPRGAAVPATPVFVAALEGMAGGPRTGGAAGAVVGAGAASLVYALVLAARLPVLERIYWNPVKRREVSENTEAIWHKDVQRRAKRRDKTSRVTRKFAQQVIVRMKTAAKHALGASRPS